MHNKIKPFGCDQCEFVAALKADIVRHIKGVHNKHKDFDCHQCGLRASQKGNLKGHIKAMHPVP